MEKQIEHDMETGNNVKPHLEVSEHVFGETLGSEPWVEIPNYLEVGARRKIPVRVTLLGVPGPKSQTKTLEPQILNP